MVIANLQIQITAMVSKLLKHKDEGIWAIMLLFIVVASQQKFIKNCCSIVVEPTECHGPIVESTQKNCIDLVYN